MTFGIDLNTAEGNRVWGHQLLSEGRIEDALEAFETAAKYDPLNAERQFEHAWVLIEQAKTESQYFRASRWGEAKLAIERGLRLDPTNEEGLALHASVVKYLANDAEATVDRTPKRMLPPVEGPRSSSGLEVRSPRRTSWTQTAPGQAPTTIEPGRIGLNIFLIPRLVFVIVNVLWIGLKAAISGVGALFTPFNITVTLIVLGLSYLAIHAWLTPLVEERRKEIDF